MAESRRVPFVFRIASDQEGHGIMYRAIVQTGPDTYNCTGTSRVGETSDGQPIWLFGRYTDVMPEAAMHEIIDDDDVQKMSVAETKKFVRKNSLQTKLNQAELYSDGKSFWFIEASGKGKNSKRKRGKSNKPGKSRKRTNRK